MIESPVSLSPREAKDSDTTHTQTRHKLADTHNGDVRSKLEKLGRRNMNVMEVDRTLKNS